MTEKQKWQIEKLRGNGAGYKTIASVTGLTRDTVRNYCKGHKVSCGVELDTDMSKLMSKGLVCKNCGSPLVQPSTGRPRSFCSSECRLMWWGIHAKERGTNSEATYHFTCAYCGKPFTAYGNKKRKYCSHECYVTDRFHI